MQAQNFVRQTLQRFARHLGLLSIAVLSLTLNPAHAQDKRWVLNGATAYDRTTDLTWQRCALGKKYFDNDCVGSGRVMTWNEALASSGSTWRLPTRDELTSILEKSAKPMIDATVFPGLDRGCCYWTSEPVAGKSEAGWHVSFSRGLAEYDPYLGPQHEVRLVRSVQ